MSLLNVACVEPTSDGLEGLLCLVEVVRHLRDRTTGSLVNLKILQQVLWEERHLIHVVACQYKWLDDRSTFFVEFDHFRWFQLDGEGPYVGHIGVRLTRILIWIIEDWGINFQLLTWFFISNLLGHQHRELFDVLQSSLLYEHVSLHGL